MASFQAKIGWKRPRKRGKRNTVMASLQVKIGWNRPRKRGNTNYRFVSFRSYPMRNRKFQTNS